MASAPKTTFSLQKRAILRDFWIFPGGYPGNRENPVVYGFGFSESFAKNGSFFRNFSFFQQFQWNWPSRNPNLWLNRSCHQKNHSMALHAPIYVFIGGLKVRNAMEPAHKTAAMRPADSAGCRHKCKVLSSKEPFHGIARSHIVIGFGFLCAMEWAIWAHKIGQKLAYKTSIQSQMPRKTHSADPQL